MIHQRRRHGPLVANSIEGAKFITLEASHISNIEKVNFTKAVVDFLTAPETAAATRAPRLKAPAKKSRGEKSAPEKSVKKGFGQSGFPKKVAAEKASRKEASVKKTLVKQNVRQDTQNEKARDIGRRQKRHPWERVPKRGSPRKPCIKKEAWQEEKLNRPVPLRRPLRLKWFHSGDGHR
jgi:hypothetical protein